MLQEEGQTFGFSPTDVYVHVPWYVSLFVLYLLFMLVLALGRLVRILWLSRNSRRPTEQPEPSLKSAAKDPWDLLDSKARSLKNFSHLTVLLSVLILALSLSHHFYDAETQKFVGFFAVEVSDALLTFSVGIFVSIVLFCIAIVCERLIHRRKLSSR